MYDVKIHNLVTLKMQYCSQNLKEFHAPLAKHKVFRMTYRNSSQFTMGLR